MESDISISRAKTFNYISLVWAFVVNQKWINKIYKLGRVDDRITVLQLATSRSKKTKPKYASRKKVLNQALGSKLDRNMLG